MEIAGKVFIVTGGASGLGEGTARMLTEAGGKVVIADMQVEKGEAIAKEIGGAFVKCDVSNEADGQVVVAKAVSMGKLMGLVNCAGIAPGEKTIGKNGAHVLSTFSKCITVNLVGLDQPAAWHHHRRHFGLLCRPGRLGGATGDRVYHLPADHPDMAVACSGFAEGLAADGDLFHHHPDHFAGRLDRTCQGGARPFPRLARR